MNRTVSRRLCLLVIAACAASAQTQSPVSTLERERLAYFQAYRVWRESDPNLERDLAGAPAADMRLRIDKARARALAYTKARAQYYETTLNGYNAVIATLGDGNQALELEDITASIKAHQAALARQTASVAAQLRAFDGEEDKTLQRQAVDRQWGALTSLQHNLADQLDQLAEASKGNSDSSRLRVLLLRHYQAAAALLRQEIGFTRQEGALWQSYYDSLSRALDNRRSVQTPAASSARAPAPSPWAGDFSYQKLNVKSYFGAQPEAAQLQVTVTDQFVQGYYRARYKLPKGVHGSPEIAFSFAGPLAPGTRQKFPLRDSEGLSGIVEIRSLAANMVEVVWNRSTPGKELANSDEILIRR